MPRRSQANLFLTAIHDGSANLRALIDAYHRTGDVADRSRATIARLKTLTGRRLRSLTGDDADAAFEAFLQAENWNSSYADSVGHRTPEGRHALSLARDLRRLRLALWGRSTIEAAMDGARLVPLHRILADEGTGDRAVVETPTVVPPA